MHVAALVPETTLMYLVHVQYVAFKYVHVHL